MTAHVEMGGRCATPTGGTRAKFGRSATPVLICTNRVTGGRRSNFGTSATPQWVAALPVNALYARMCAHNQTNGNECHICHPHPTGQVLR